MKRNGVAIRLELDQETNQRLRQMAEQSGRSKHSMCRIILRRRAQRWFEKRTQRQGSAA